MDARRSTVTAGPTAWSLVAGAYLFCCAVLALGSLGAVTRTLAPVLGVPTGPVTVVFAAPAPVLGAVAWWLLVERRGTYGYLRGVAAGVAAAVGTVACWVLVGGVIWGPQLVVAGAILVGFVLVVAAPAGAVAGVPLVYARRRLSAG
jgi:hypothetical protein